MQNYILAIDTSCDDTSAAVVSGRRVLSNVISAQENLHTQFGGVMPTLAKLEHAKRIDGVIALAMKRAKVDFEDLAAIAVTRGPGLAIALEVGITKAKELAAKYNLPLLPINHMEGHLLSALAQNQAGQKSTLVDKLQPQNWLGLLISGGHTEIIKIDDFGKYHKVGSTLDDACGESFDKSARLLGLGYPGGAVLSELARQARPHFTAEIKKHSSGVAAVITAQGGYASKLNGTNLQLPIPLANSSELNFSFSGLKTAFWQLVEQVSKALDQQKDLTTSQSRVEGVQFDLETTAALCLLFEVAATEHLKQKLAKALQLYPSTDVLLGGGVVNNIYIRAQLRQVCRTQGAKLHFPYSRKLFVDNAAMIGIAANTKLNQLNNLRSSELDRLPNWSITQI